MTELPKADPNLEQKIQGQIDALYSKVQEMASKLEAGGQPVAAGPEGGNEKRQQPESFGSSDFKEEILLQIQQL